MGITRTPIIDDDGTGTTGTVIDNAWKTELYDQIDAFQTYGTWTPVDASGAGLTFTVASGLWAKSGRVVFLWFQVIYPATANGAASSIGGLPFTVRSPTGGAQGYGAVRGWYFPVNVTPVVQPLDPTVGVPAANSAMSGANVTVSATYLTD